MAAGPQEKDDADPAHPPRPDSVTPAAAGPTQPARGRAPDPLTAAGLPDAEAGSSRPGATTLPGAAPLPGAGTAATARTASGLPGGSPAIGTVAASSSSAADPSAAAERLLRRLEARGLVRGLEALAAERRAAPALVSELLARPDAAQAAVADPRFATAEVVWRLLEVSREEEAAIALRQLVLARTVAERLAAAHPGPGQASSSPRAGGRSELALQLRVEVACETAQRQVDGAEPAAAAAALRDTAALLRPELGYARAVYCRAMAKLRRAQQRWEEALALGDRAVRLLRQHGTAPERAAAVVELGWLMLEAGDADEAVPLFKRALAAVETVPYPAIYCRLGLAVALVESGQSDDPGDIDQLLVDSEWMIHQTRLPVDPHRLQALAAQAAARCRRDPPR